MDGGAGGGTGPHAVIPSGIGGGGDGDSLAEFHSAARGEGQVAGTVALGGDVHQLVIRLHIGDRCSPFHHLRYAGGGNFLYILAGDQLAADPGLLIDGCVLAVHTLPGHPFLALGQVRCIPVNRFVLRLFRHPLENRQVIGDRQHHAVFHQLDAHHLPGTGDNIHTGKELLHRFLPGGGSDGLAAPADSHHGTLRQYGVFTALAGIQVQKQGFDAGMAVIQRCGLLSVAEQIQGFSPARGARHGDGQQQQQSQTAAQPYRFWSV